MNVLVSKIVLAERELGPVWFPVVSSLLHQSYFASSSAAGSLCVVQGRIANCRTGQSASTCLRDAKDSHPGLLGEQALAQRLQQLKFHCFVLSMKNSGMTNSNAVNEPVTVGRE